MIHFCYFTGTTQCPQTRAVATEQMERHNDPAPLYNPVSSNEAALAPTEGVCKYLRKNGPLLASSLLYTKSTCLVPCLFVCLGLSNNTFALLALVVSHREGQHLRLVRPHLCNPLVSHCRLGPSHDAFASRLVGASLAPHGNTVFHVLYRHVHCRLALVVAHGVITVHVSGTTTRRQ